MLTLVLFLLMGCGDGPGSMGLEDIRVGLAFELGWKGLVGCCLLG